MRLSLIIFLMASCSTCSCSSILIRPEEHLSSRNQQSNQLEQQDSRLNGHPHHQHNLDDQPQQKVKYSTFQDEKLTELKKIDIFNNFTSESRTFGIRRKIQMVVPIVMYKLGLVTSMLGLLTFLAAKSLLVGIIILIVQLTSGAAKLALLKKEHHPHQEGWEEPHHPPKPLQNIHVHVHGNSGGHGYYKEYYKPSYSSHPWANSKSDSLTDKIDEDYYQRLKELQELKELRQSLYQQVI